MTQNDKEYVAQLERKYMLLKMEVNNLRRENEKLRKRKNYADKFELVFDRR